MLMIKFEHGCCFALIKVVKIKGKINFIAFFCAFHNENKIVLLTLSNANENQLLTVVKACRLVT
jgi:hypothetical protein